MAPKRHHGDDNTVEVEPSVQLKMTSKRHHGGDDTAAVELSSPDFSKPVYLVAKVSADDKSSSANSVFLVDAAAVAGGNNPSPRERARARARHLGELPDSQLGMSFAAAHSKHGSWIVAVGGPKGSTIIYDPSTLESFRAPTLNSPKHEPILISHGGKVYAISRKPSVRPGRSRRDFEPWFESINFKKGIPCILHEDCSEWNGLPPPPFFPCLLDPLEYRNPPKISVSSYASVGSSHILISPKQEDVAGTYAFHVVEKTWEKVYDKNLPFLGQAVHLDGSLFAACSNNFDGVATASVFRMSMEVSMSPAAVSPHKLSVIRVQQFPVAPEWKVPRPLFCPLGKGGFCAIRKVSFRPKKECLKMKMSLTSFQMEPMLLTACQTESADSGDLHVAVKVEQHDRRCKFMVQSQDLHSPYTVVAALSMKQSTDLD